LLTRSINSATSVGLICAISRSCVVTRLHQSAEEFTEREAVKRSECGLEIRFEDTRRKAIGRSFWERLSHGWGGVETGARLRGPVVNRIHAMKNPIYRDVQDEGEFEQGLYLGDGPAAFPFGIGRLLNGGLRRDLLLGHATRHTEVM
jgi:hypothetical protein